MVQSHSDQLFFLKHITNAVFRADWANPGAPIAIWVQPGGHHSTASRLSWSSIRAGYYQPFCTDQSAGGWQSMTLRSCRPFHTSSLRKIQCIFWPRTVSNCDHVTWCQQEDKWRPSSPGSDGAGSSTCCARMPTPSPKLQSTGPRGKVEAWSTEDYLAKNCGRGPEEHEPQLGHHPEAGQCRTGVAELCCCPIYASWRDG